MPRYMLLLRDRQATGQPTNEELTEIYRRFGAWKEGLKSQGRLIHSERLNDDGAVFVHAGSNLETSSGPHVANSEVMSACFVVDVRTSEEAEEVVRTCPQLDFGSVELREIFTG